MRTLKSLLLSWLAAATAASAAASDKDTMPHPQTVIDWAVAQGAVVSDAYSLQERMPGSFGIFAARDVPDPQP